MERLCNRRCLNKPIEDFYTRGKAKGYSSYCKPCMKERNKEIRSKNPQKIADYQKEYHQKNRLQINKWKKGHRKQSIEKNFLYGFKEILRSRIYTALIRFSKNKTTEGILGCSFNEARAHIESQFTDGMAWDNRGVYGWHIDHIKPLSSAKTILEAEELRHYTNLQPLWAKDNISKSNKL